MPSSNKVRKVTSENYPTDAGREGELIFRLVYEQAGCKKPVSRLWLSSMEDNAIREGFANLKPSTEYDALYQAALCRERADWMVGINCSRLFSCLYALNNEAEFMAQVCSASEDRQEKAARSIRQRKQRNEKRTDELTRLIRKLYEDNVSGRLSDTLFEQMLRDFEAELSDLTEIVSQDQQELERISRETINAEKFLSLVRKYTDFSELTPAMINEFVEKILVHQAQGKGASRIQEIEIFFNFVGKVDIPHKEVELTEEEKAALAEQERRRAKKAEYNRRYMEKKRRQWKEQQEQEQAEQLPLAAEQKGEHIA